MSVVNFPTPTPEGDNTQSKYINSLQPAQRAKLLDSGITDEVAEARGYLSSILPEQLTARGFSKSQVEGHHLGLMIPLWNYLGGQPTWQYRPDKPRMNAKGKIIKYETPAGTHPILDINPILIKQGKLHDILIPLFITEGSIKADAGISKGLCVLAVSGVSNWRGKGDHGASTMLAEFDNIAIAERRVIIAYDSDAHDNPNVYREQIKLARGLKGKHARVEFCIIPHAEDGSKQGLDDYLKNHSVEELLALCSNKLPPKPREHDKVLPINGFNLNDHGNAQRFTLKYKPSVRYVETWGQWLIWDGKHWQRDNVLQIQTLAKTLIADMEDEAHNLADPHERDGLTKHAHRTGNLQRMRAIYEYAKDIDQLGAAPQEFDRFPMLVAANNGTIDLETGQLYQHDPEAFITHLIPYDYNPDARSNDWDQFITLASNNDQDVAEYLQRVAGYCLTGLTKEGGIFYIIGLTRRGKTTFIQALRDTWGTYAYKTTFDTLLAGNKSKGSANPDVADMEGKRLVIASEVTHGRKFDEAMLKELTAGDTVTARQLYAKNHEFTPQLKLFLAANDFPYIRSDDSGAWARLHITEFNNAELASRVHLNLKQRILDPNNKEVHQAILTWAVKGTLKWLKDDSLMTPASTVKSTKRMQDQMNPLAEWHAEQIIPDETGKEKLQDLYEAYTHFYFLDRSTRLLGRSNFTAKLESMGYRKHRYEAGTYIVGLRLQTPQ